MADTIQQLIEKQARLVAELAKAMGVKGAKSGGENLQSKEIIDELELLTKKLATATGEAPVAEPKTVPSQKTTRRDTALKPRPVRELLVEVLDDFGFMTYSRLLALYVEARYGREIPLTRFGALSKDEEKAFLQGRPKEVWLCHALTHDRGLPIKRLWTKSAWPLHERIVAPTTGRVQHLKMAARLAELALSLDGAGSQPDMMRILAADHARDLPNVNVQRGKFALEEWRDIAKAELAKVEPRDVALRLESANRLDQELDSRSKLFGAPEELTIIPGGRDNERRSEA